MGIVDMKRDELLDKLAMELADWPLDSGQARRAMPGVEWVTMGASVFAEVFDGRDIGEKEYLQRRAELINKPSWDSHKWPKIVQTDDGKWFGVNAEYRMSIVSEFKGECIWIKRGEGEYLCSHQSPIWPIAGHDWRQTLERRPESPCMDCGTTGSIHASDCPSHEWDQGERRMENIGRNGGDGDHYEGITGVKHRASHQETRHDCKRCGGSHYTPPHDECPCADGATTKSDTGLKFDTGKPRMELLIQGMPRALEAVGQVLTFGAKKYAAHNWKLVDGAEDRYWAAKCRHELLRAKGEEKDPETGLLHLAHEATNALFLLELALANQAEDKP